LNFCIRQLANIGLPWVLRLSKAIQTESPLVAWLLLQTWFESLLGVLVTLIGLCALGWASTRMIGIQLIRAIDAVIERLPLVQIVYGSSKKLIAALQHKPDSLQRVVLIEFPSPGMKAVGFVTRTLTDVRTGQQFAAVYVPTTPNPTSGYLEIIPLHKVTPTDWTFDEALSFIISGGAVAPESLYYDGNTVDKDP
jgi:uncharacterized membrane protein